MQTENKDTLAGYGAMFQGKVISVLLSDGRFYSSIQDIIKSQYFDSDASKWIVSTIGEYFAQYGVVPTMDVLSIKHKEIDDTVLSTMVKRQLQTSYSMVGASDSDFVRDKFKEFCINRNLKETILTAADLISQDENYENIYDLLERVTTVGVDDDLGLDYIEDIDSRLLEEKRNTIPTPWEVIDDVTHGGSGPGELFVIVAPSGVGKSWGLAAVGAHAIQNNKTVFHYTLELAEIYTGRRYDSIITGMNIQALESDSEKVKRIVSSKTNGKLLVKQYPTKSASANTLKGHIKRAKAAGIVPDLVIVDYGDLLRPSGKSTDSKYEEMGGIYEELRGLAGELEIPIWTASQANRQSIERDVIQADSIADSYAKVMTADFILSVSRKAKDKISNTARVHIVKNRFGPDGMTFPTKMDTSCGLIEIYEPNSSKGILAHKESENGKAQQMDNLKKKYNDMKNGKSVIKDKWEDVDKD